MKFSLKLKQLLARHRMSQEALAEQIGVSQNLVSRWTQGKGVPDMDKALLVAKAFRVDLNYLADDSLEREVSAETSADELTALDLYRGYRDELGAAHALKAMAKLASGVPSGTTFEHQIDEPAPVQPKRKRSF